MNLPEVDSKYQCLLDSAATHTILKDRKYFSKLTMYQANINTISGTAKLIEGSGKACIVLTNGTKLTINDALYSSKSRRNLLSFKDVRQWISSRNNDSGSKRIFMPHGRKMWQETYL